MPASGSDASAAGVLDEATLQSLKAAPLPTQINPQVRTLVNNLAASTVIKQALNHPKGDEARFVQEAIQLSEIPAPTFADAKRVRPSRPCCAPMVSRIGGSIQSAM